MLRQRRIRRNIVDRLHRDLHAALVARDVKRVVDLLQQLALTDPENAALILAVVDLVRIESYRDLDE
jgi:hypothetical protein